MIRNAAVAALFCVMALEGQYLVPANRNRPNSGSVSNGGTRVTYDRQQLAGISADMRVLQEDLRMLLGRLEALEQENAAKNTLIRDLQERQVAYERRLQQMEREQRQALVRIQTELNQAYEKGLSDNAQATQKALDSLRATVVSELSRVEQVAVRAANASARRVPQATLTGAYKEVQVQQGDTLSAIANAAGVSVSTLRQVNGLKSDVIRIGQVLKIPVPQQ